MNIEEQEKLEIKVIEILEQLIAVNNMKYGELHFVVLNGKIDNWRIGKHKKRKDLTTK